MKAEIRRILIVDDSPHDLMLAVSALAEKNLANEVDLAEDGAEALDYLHKRGKFAGLKSILPVAILLAGIRDSHLSLSP